MKVGIDALELLQVLTRTLTRRLDGLAGQALLQQQKAYAAYVDGVVTPVPGKPGRFDTHFMHSPSSTWIHGWDLLLGAGQAVGATLDEEEQITGVSDARFLRSVHGNLSIQVGDSLPQEAGLSFLGSMQTSRGRVLSFGATPNGDPAYESPFEVATSPLAASGLNGYTTVVSSIQPLHGLSPVLIEEVDFAQKGAMLADIFSLTSYAGARTIPPGAWILITGVKDLSVPRFTTLANPGSIILSRSVAKWTSRKCVQMESVRSVFVNPRTGPDGGVTITFACLNKEQWDKLPD